MKLRANVRSQWQWTKLRQLLVIVLTRFWVLFPRMDKPKQYPVSLNQNRAVSHL